MSDAKELAFRYDLFITPDWRDRFDTLINDNLELPLEGRILDINCGTGAHALELAERMRGSGEVIGLDPSAERIASSDAPKRCAYCSRPIRRSQSAICVIAAKSLSHSMPLIRS